MCIYPGHLSGHVVECLHGQSFCQETDVLWSFAGSFRTYEQIKPVPGDSNKIGSHRSQK